MHFIPRNVHAYLDYIVGALLLAAPFLLGFEHVEAARNTAMIMGGGAIAYSLLTSYELGLIRVIPFSVHLVLDAMSGIFLAASPWILGYADQVYLPHLVVGLLEVAVVLFTSRAPAENHVTHTGEAAHHH